MGDESVLGIVVVGELSVGEGRVRRNDIHAGGPIRRWEKSSGEEGDEQRGRWR